MSHRRSPAARRSGARVALLAAALATTLGAATSAGAATWTAPQAVPGVNATPAPLIFTGDGRAIAFPSAAGPDGPVTQITPLDPVTGAPIAAHVQSHRIASPQAVGYSRDHYVLAGSTLDARGTISDRSHVQVAYGTGGGDIGPLRGITGSTGERSFALAANDDGVIAIVLGNAKERRLLVRRPNGRGFVEAFSATVGAQGRGATVAIGAQGDVLMAWENEHRIYARHVGPSGGLGAIHHVGDGVQSHLQAAVEAGGRLMIAWVSQRVGEGEAATPASVSFVTAAPGKAFNKARHLEDVGQTGAGRYVSDPAVRLLTGGASLLTWTGYDAASQHYVVRVAALGAGHAGTPQTVSDPAAGNAVLGDLAVDAAGDAAVIWRIGIAGADPDGGAEAIQAATRAGTTAPFGAPATLEQAPAAAPGAPAAFAFAYPPRVALAPKSGAALAEWGELAGTSSLFHVAARPAP